MCLVLPMCILTSCSSVLCVLVALGMFVNVMSFLFVFPVCAYCGVVGVF